MDKLKDYLKEDVNFEEVQSLVDSYASEKTKGLSRENGSLMNASA